VGHSDNATHFKSKESLYHWSQRMDKVEFINMVWIKFGCPGHGGKGPWDGIGAMVKTIVTRDMTNEHCLTPSGQIASQLDVAQHVRATFCTEEWVREHFYVEINECVVMYLDIDEINRPAVSDDVSPVPGILSHHSDLFLSRDVYAMRPHRCWCWCLFCSGVCGRGLALGTISRGSWLDVSGCRRAKLTIFKEGTFTVSHANGIANRNKRLADLSATLEKQIGPGKYAYVQVRELWSTTEERHYRPGHGWLCELGDAGDGSCVERTFKLGRASSSRASWEVYKGVRFYDSEKALTVKRWLHRVDEDASGLTFGPWEPSEHELDPNEQRAHMIINLSEVRGVATVGRGVKAELREVLPPDLEPAGRGQRTCSARVLATERTVYVMRTDVDNTWRARCE